MQVISESPPDSFVIYMKGDIDATASILLNSEINKIYRSSLKKIWVDTYLVENLSSAGVSLFISHLQNFNKRNLNPT